MTQGTGTDVATVYTTRALVAPWVGGDDYVTDQADGAGPSDEIGKLSPDDLADRILHWSREADGKLWSFGFQTPFPAVTATNPRLPFRVRELVTMRVAAQVRAEIKMGSTQTENAVKIREMADAIEAELKAAPHSLGRVEVRTVERVFAYQVGTAGSNVGLMHSNIYRLANRNVYGDSVRFVDSTGAEVYDPSGMGFRHGSDFKMLSEAQGTIIIVNSAISSRVGSGGGVQYDYSWVRFDRFNTRQASIQGVRG